MKRPLRIRQTVTGHNFVRPEKEYPPWGMTLWERFFWNILKKCIKW